MTHAAGDSAESQKAPGGEANKDTASEGAAAAKNAASEGAAAAKSVASKGATAAKDAASEGAKLASKAGVYLLVASATLLGVFVVAAYLVVCYGVQYSTQVLCNCFDQV